MFEVNELVKYRMPLDADYSYGVITELKKGKAEIVLKTYPFGLVVEIPYRYIEHIERRCPFGISKGKNNK